MSLTLSASTGAKIVVWREGDVFQARGVQSTEPPQVCLAVDLFEVIAELAGLNLDEGAAVAEATELASQARARLTADRGPAAWNASAERK